MFRMCRGWQLVQRASVDLPQRSISLYTLEHETISAASDLRQCQPATREELIPADEIWERSRRDGTLEVMNDPVSSLVDAGGAKIRNVVTERGLGLLGAGLLTCKRAPQRRVRPRAGWPSCRVMETTRQVPISRFASAPWLLVDWPATGSMRATIVKAPTKPRTLRILLPFGLCWLNMRPNVPNQPRAAGDMIAQDIGHVGCIWRLGSHRRVKSAAEANTMAGSSSRSAITQSESLGSVQ